MPKISVIHGPNLNLLGQREQSTYGNRTLDQINHELADLATHLQIQIDFFQSNIEGEIVDFIQAQQHKCDFIIINAGAYTHTSIAIRDAFVAVKIPFIEVHLSHLDKREEFRKTSYLSDIAEGVIYGFGPLGYELAIMAIGKMILEN